MVCGMHPVDERLIREQLALSPADRIRHLAELNKASVPGTEAYKRYWQLRARPPLLPAVVAVRRRQTPEERIEAAAAAHPQIAAMVRRVKRRTGPAD